MLFRFLNHIRLCMQNVKQNIFHCLCLVGRTGPLILCPGFFKMRPYVDAPVIGHVVCVGVKGGNIATLTTNLHATTCDCHLHFPNPSPTAQHAEVGAIKAGCDTLYITYQPCPDCAAKMIEGRTVQAVYYRDQDSKASTESIELLRGAGIYVSNDWIK